MAPWMQITGNWKPGDGSYTSVDWSSPKSRLSIQADGEPDWTRRKIDFCESDAAEAGPRFNMASSVTGNAFTRQCAKANRFNDLNFIPRGADLLFLRFRTFGISKVLSFRTGVGHKTQFIAVRASLNGSEVKLYFCHRPPWRILLTFTNERRPSCQLRLTRVAAIVMLTKEM
jgi:hypothetical protein